MRDRLSAEDGHTDERYDNEHDNDVPDCNRLAGDCYLGEPLSEADRYFSDPLVWIENCNGTHVEQCVHKTNSECFWFTRCKSSKQGSDRRPG